MNLADSIVSGALDHEDITGVKLTQCICATMTWLRLRQELYIGQVDRFEYRGVTFRCTHTKSYGYRLE